MEKTEEILRPRLHWIVWAMVIAGFYLRFQYGQLMSLNGDETQIMLPPLLRGLWNVYQGGTLFPYGPFCNFLLHFMTFFGSSEWFFRLPSMIAGALIPYVVYRWLSETVNPAAGFAAALFLAFSRNLIHLSAEVRHYMVHTLFVACAMYCLERAFREQSQRWMRWFGVSLLLALLTMYMSIWFTAAIGVYAFIRIVRGELPRNVTIEWLGFQMAAGAICVIAYVTHLSKLRGSSGEEFARNGWLKESYYHPESQDLFDFLTSATDALFGYVFSEPRVGAWMMAAFVVGAGLLAARSPGRLRALSLILPLAATASAASMGVYPYGGSRHDVFLGIFVTAGVSVALSAMVRQKSALLVLAGALWLPVWPTAHHFLDHHPHLNSIAQMREMLAYLKALAPRPGVLVTDESGSFILRYYLCKGKLEDERVLAPDLKSCRCAGHTILYSTQWSLKEEELEVILDRGLQQDRERFPMPAWIFRPTDNGSDVPAPPDPDGGFFGRMHLLRTSR